MRRRRSGPDPHPISALLTTRFRSPCGALLLAAIALAPARARAQGEDARVLPRGWIEFRALGLFTQFDSRFGDGGKEALGDLFSAQLQPAVERVLNPLATPVRAQLDTFFTNTAGQVQSPVTPEAPGIGTARADLAGDVRRAPFRLSYGLNRRVTLSVTVPIERNGTSVAGIALAGSTLGLNTAAATNQAVLQKVGAQYAALGNAVLLPTRGSAAGAELQRRVGELSPGDSLVLPTHGVSPTELLGTAALAGQLTGDERAALGSTSAAQGFYLGDVEVGARLQLVNRVRITRPDSLSPAGVRAAISLNLRLPTGPAADTAFLLVLPREVGHAGVSADAYGDVFLARRYWVSASAGFTHLLPRDVLRRPFSEIEPFPSDTVPFRLLRREPGTRLRASLMPRYRLSREMTFAAAYQFEHAAATQYTAADSLGDAVGLGPLERTEAWTAHAFGVGASYSTLAAYAEGKTSVPVEFSLLYRNVVMGSGFAPHAGSIEVTGRVLYQLVGRPRRPRADSAATDSAHPLPPPPPPAPAGPVVVPPAERAPRPAPPPPPPPSPPYADAERPRSSLAP